MSGATPTAMSKHSSLSSVPVSLVLAALVPLDMLRAQGCAHYPDANATTGASSIAPFGHLDPQDPPTANQAILFKVPRTLLPTQPTRICELGFASAGTRVREFAALSVRLGQSNTPGLVPTFGSNMPGFTQEVISQADWRWTTPADQWQFVGLTSAFPYDPANGDLVVMITVAGGTSTGTGSTGFRSDPSTPSVLQTAWRFAPTSGVVGTGAPKIRVCWDAADLQVFGGGCAGSHQRVPRLDLTGSSRLGGTLRIDLLDAGPNCPAALLFLDGRLRAAPLDLAPFGAPGCKVDTFFTIQLVVPVQGGAVAIPVNVPNQAALRCAVLWAQWLPVDLPANALGITASSFGRILVGS